jgi:lysophospholipase L1-like esterase
MADQATDPAAPPPRRGRRWLFAVATALVFAGVLELAARLALPRASLPVLIEPLKNDVNHTPAEFFRPHPTLFWELLPDVNQEGRHYFGDVTNRDGLRMRNGVGPKDGRPRVVCLGDSCTYGLGVPVDDSWPSLLARDPALDVVNAGVPGYSSYQGAVFADMRCPEWRPDVVVVEYGINDSLTWLQFDHGKVVAMTDVERAPHVRLDFLLKKSALVGWIASLAGGAPTPKAVAPEALADARRAAGSADREYAIAQSLMRYDHRDMTPRVTPDELRANLVRIAAHAPHALVLKWPRRRLLDPSRQDAMSLLRLEPYDAAVRSVASDRIEVVDFDGPLVASGLTADQAFIDPVHGTRALYELVARVVRDKLRERLGR